MLSIPYIALIAALITDYLSAESKIKIKVCVFFWNAGEWKGGVQRSENLGVGGGGWGAIKQY